MRAQIEILASLQMVDREIREQNVIKQGLKGELESEEKEILGKKQEIGSLKALCAEKEKTVQARPPIRQMIRPGPSRLCGR